MIVKTVMRKLAYITSLTSLTAVAIVVCPATSAYAQSSKAAWRFEELVALPHAVANDSGGPSATNDTGWVNILTTHIKTPNAKELAVGVSLQCGLITDTSVRSKNGDLDSSAARGKIAVRVAITQPDGVVVYAQPSNGADLSTDIALNGDGVTYCDRYQKLAAKFSGLNCTADLLTGVVTCADPEELQLILKTLTAHHFNFIHANAVPGVQKVSVQARAQAGILLGGTALGDAGAEAFTGAGALSVEVIQLVKDANGTTDLDNLR
jgi:hypothetical protein